ncbi:MAG TPA: DHHA1 domain-containing protein [Candidatus Acidoferrales bacterium]|nr:DHHA1 domain-containing protein [Candidatus Acidoferrales bacterium]
MTERLYYNDSFLREFDAQVVACEPADGRWRVRLDRTAFYPTSGGQPFDTGTLNRVNVVEVLDDAADNVIHLTEEPLNAGTAVHGVIDWTRRFDHMQQHTAQHLLSAAFIERFQFQTVSFHMGRDISTIDLATPSVVPRHLEDAESRVNEIICEDRPIKVRYGTAEELAADGIRKKVDREGTLRVVEIESFDRQPCGGTHLSRTGQAGLLLIRKCERQKQNWRIEFVAGFRALATAREDLVVLKKASEQFGCAMAKLPEMVGKAQEERRSLQREARKLTERLVELEAAELLGDETKYSADGAPKIVSVVSQDATASYLAMLAAKLVVNSGVRAILASRGAKTVVLAQSAELDGDMGAMLRELLAAVGGKGGGSKVFAQGTVSDMASLDKVVAGGRARLIALGSQK